jgi:hypothetical protein
MQLKTRNQVTWLGIAFAWGTFNLVGTFSNLSTDPKFEIDSSGGPAEVQSGNNDWTFGQVMSVVLLVAPLLTIIEYFNPGKSYLLHTAPVVNPESVLICLDFEEQNESTSGDLSIQPAVPVHQTPLNPYPVSMDDGLDDLESPSLNWGHRSHTFRVAFSYAFLTCYVMTCFAWISGGEPLRFLIWHWKALPMALAGLYGVILFSLFFETAISKRLHWLKNALQVVNVTFFLFCWSIAFAEVYWPNLYWWPLCFAFALYIFCAALYTIFG